MHLQGVVGIWNRFIWRPVRRGLLGDILGLPGAIVSDVLVGAQSTTSTTKSSVVEPTTAAPVTVAPAAPTTVTTKKPDTTAAIPPISSVVPAPAPPAATTPPVTIPAATNPEATSPPAAIPTAAIPTPTTSEDEVAESSDSATSLAVGPSMSDLTLSGTSTLQSLLPSASTAVATAPPLSSVAPLTNTIAIAVGAVVAVLIFAILLLILFARWMGWSFYDRLRRKKPVEKTDILDKPPGPYMDDQSLLASAAYMEAGHNPNNYSSQHDTHAVMHTQQPPSSPDIALFRPIYSFSRTPTTSSRSTKSAFTMKDVGYTDSNSRRSMVARSMSQATHSTHAPSSVESWWVRSIHQDSPPEINRRHSTLSTISATSVASSTVLSPTMMSWPDPPISKRYTTDHTPPLPPLPPLPPMPPAVLKRALQRGYGMIKE